ncbi:MAG: D-glycero-beta-D-manno-heptose-7-phosphate kinase [Candidatus Woesearchaeota archaeon]
MKHEEILNKFQNINIMVVGDIMLDKYIFGSVERISPEAPVPILKVNSEKYMLGAAANVANNIISLGGKAFLVGVIGNDEPGTIFLNELKNRNIASSGIILSSKIQTTQKVRVISKNNQLIRLDYEETENNEETALIKIIQENIINFDLIIISDYAKGVITKNLIKTTIELSKKYNKKIIVDTKPSHKEFFKDIYLIKLNQKETEGISQIKLFNEESVSIAARYIKEYLNCHVLITRGEKGMSLLDKKNPGQIINIPTQAKEVYDVSGAGDTTMAAIGLCIAAGANLVESVEIANYAAGIVVGKFGTSIVSLSELKMRFEEQNKKIVSREKIIKILKYYKSMNKKIVFTNGCFDILHTGHVRLLQKAKSFGDILVVGLNTDESIKKIKGPERPIINQEDRAEILSSLDCVDYIVFFDENNPCEIISEIKPDIHVKGGDYNPNDYKNMPEAKIVHEYGGEVKIINLVDGKSTTNIINKIKTNLKKS